MITVYSVSYFYLNLKSHIMHTTRITAIKIMYTMLILSSKFIPPIKVKLYSSLTEYFFEYPHFLHRYNLIFLYGLESFFLRYILASDINSQSCLQKQLRM